MRCINCGQHILIHNITISSYITNICGNCSSKMGIIDTALVLYDKNKQDEIDAHNRYKASNPIKIKNVPESISYENDDIDYGFIDINKHTEYKISMLERQRLLIDKANSNNVDAHAFDSNGKCFFCKSHIDILNDDDYFCDIIF